MMPRLACFSALVAFVAAGAFAAAPAARISPTFPTPDEKRDPDRTLQKTEPGAARVIAYSPDGRILATAGDDKVVRLWDARTGEQGDGKLLQSLAGHTREIAALGFSADGKSLLSLAEDQGYTIWDPATGKARETGTVKAAVRNSVFVPGNDPLLAECTAEGVRIWDLRGGSIAAKFSVRSEPVRYVAFTPDGKVMAAVTRTGGVRLWNRETGELQRSFETLTAVAGVLVSPTHVATGGSHGGMQLWPVAGGDPIGVPANFPAAFTGRGDQLAATVDRAVKVWDVATNTLLCSQEGHAADLAAVAFNPNSQKLASSDLKGAVNYWTAPLPPIPPADLEKIKAALPEKATATPKKPRRLLVFWRADAILHKSGVPAVNHAIELLGEKTGAFSADFSRDYAALDPKVLADYDGIVMNSTAHLVIPDAARKALVDFARRGGGVIGVHAAIDMFKPWPDAAAIIGATFGGHPWGPSGTWAIKLEAPDHPLNRAWKGKNFKMRDELYVMAEPYTRADRRVLLAMDISDPATAKPGSEPLHRTDGDFGIAWIKRFGQGRVFYGGFGHIGEPFQDPAVLQFYLDGIQYALGDLELSPEDDAPPAK